MLQIRFLKKIECFMKKGNMDEIVDKFPETINL